MARFHAPRSRPFTPNPNTQQLEADFIYTAPEHATVTGFAYWFKGEKVVARVVEKERAAQIYDLITRPVYNRDPAIVEMIGKNTFRARISPVEARAAFESRSAIRRAACRHARRLAMEFSARAGNQKLSAGQSGSPHEN